jgi:hypothetical protein
LNPPAALRQQAPRRKQSEWAKREYAAAGKYGAVFDLG